MGRFLQGVFINLNGVGQVKRYRHYKDKWYALYKMNKEVWAVVVYAEDEEEVLFSCIELTEGEAIHAFNKIRKELGGKQ